MVEVNNGGHNQFFFNSSGTVYQEALEALKLIGCKDAHALLQAVVDSWPHTPSLHTQKRRETMLPPEQDYQPAEWSKWDAEALRFYNLKGGIYKAAIYYLNTHRSEFYFDGVVAVPSF